MIIPDKKEDIQEELELTEMMVKDLNKIWKSYAKKALEAKQARELKQEKKGFLQYETVEELIEGWGFGEFDEDTYYRGLEYFESLTAPPKISVIEKHRNRIKQMINDGEGTIKMLNEELNPQSKKPEENIFEKMDREESQKRQETLLINEFMKK